MRCRTTTTLKRIKDILIFEKKQDDMQNSLTGKTVFHLIFIATYFIFTRLTGMSWDYCGDTRLFAGQSDGEAPEMIFHEGMVLN